MHFANGSRMIVGVLVTVLAMTWFAPAAHAADELAPAVAWDAPAYSGYVGVPVKLAGTVTEAPDGATVRIDVVTGESSRPVAGPIPIVDGRFSLSLAAPASELRLRAVLSDATGVIGQSPVASLRGTKAPVTLTLSIPRSAKDYTRVTARAVVVAKDGRKPSGRVVVELRRSGTKKWRTVATISVKNGKGTRRITPRHDGRYRLVFAGSSQYAAKTSASRAFDNRPPGRVVTLPRGASRPSVKLPKQPRGSRARADAKISKISDGVWKSMSGRSWRKGCPVGRQSLRVVKVSYWAFDGYVRRGEIVVNKSVASSTAKLFTDLFAAKAPIRSMYRVDRFGYSKTLRGADDLRSMRADNTSGFNCRRVVGWTSRMSPHAVGRSIDINPWENPFASRTGYQPNNSWAKRTKPAAITYRGTNDPVVKIFRKHGFRWLGKSDLQHFQR